MNAYTQLTLLLARALITDRFRWTSGALARDSYGRVVSPLDDDAVSWCALGAVYRTVGGDLEAFTRVVDTLDEACRALYGTSIRAVNDSPSPFAHCAVLSAFDAAVDEAARASARVVARRPHRCSQRTHTIMGRIDDLLYRVCAEASAGSE
jgi:hypothetical protein